MTRAEVIDRLSDVMQMHGFVGANSNLPATAGDVTGLMAQLFTKGEEIVEQLDTEEPEEPAPGYGI